MNFKLVRNVWANKQVYALLLASFYSNKKQWYQNVWLYKYSMKLTIEMFDWIGNQLILHIVNWSIPIDYQLILIIDDNQ